MSKQKCTSKPNGYADTVCDALYKYSDISPAGNRKGVFHGSIVNIETKERLGEQFYLNNPANQKGKYLMEFCPFCGGKLFDKEQGE